MLQANEDSSHNGQSRLSRRKFSPEEDRMLLRLVEANGPHRWDNIAAAVPGRTGRQCRDRFRNYLMPNLNSEPWSPEEDRILVTKYHEIGSHWSRIAEFLNGRSSNSVKNRWYTYHQKNVKREEAADDLGIDPPEIQLSPISTVPTTGEKQKPKVHIFQKSAPETKSGNQLSQRLQDILV